MRVVSAGAEQATGLARRSELLVAGLDAEGGVEGSERCRNRHELRIQSALDLAIL